MLLGGVCLRGVWGGSFDGERRGWVKVELVRGGFFSLAVVGVVRVFYGRGQRLCTVVVADLMRGLRVPLGSTVIGFDVLVTTSRSNT